MHKTNTDDEMEVVHLSWSGALPVLSSSSCLTRIRIHGGGFTIGTKSATNNPSGLIKASQNDGSPGIIYVALNYRLGALGWLAGPTLQGAGGVSNAGLYDQRLALEWVSNNIHLFGGDPEQITVIGESAGGIDTLPCARTIYLLS
jgi:carboxylesterase type B